MGEKHQNKGCWGMMWLKQQGPFLLKFWSKKFKNRLKRESSLEAGFLRIFTEALLVILG